MKKKHLKLFFITILFLLLITACSNSIHYSYITENDFQSSIVDPYPDTLNKEVVLYFGNLAVDNKLKLYRESVVIEYSPDHLEEAILEALKSGPKHAYHLKNVFSPHLEILDVNVVKDAAFVNFSSKNLYGGEKEESLLIASIVKTLTELKKIKKVFFHVDGKKVESLMGHITARNYFGKESVDILLEDQESIYALTLWFPDRNNDIYTSAIQEVRWITNPPDANTVIGNLLIGPTTPYARSCIPSNIKILDVNVERKTAYVNFSSKNLYTYKGNFSIEYDMRDCIVKSLLKLDNIDEVVFLVDGNKGFKLFEKVSIYKPFTDSDVITEEETHSTNDNSRYAANIYHPPKKDLPIKFIPWRRYFTHPPTPEDIIESLLIKPSYKAIDRSFEMPYITNILHKNDTVYINFASGDIELNRHIYEKMELSIVASIVKSLCDLEDVQWVIFLIDGKESNTFINNVSIRNPMNTKALDDIFDSYNELDIFTIQD